LEYCLRFSERIRISGYRPSASGSHKLVAMRVPSRVGIIINSVCRTPAGSFPGSGISGLNSCASLGHKYKAPDPKTPSSVAPLSTSSRRFIVNGVPVHR
jgi:hypothetical protein